MLLVLRQPRWWGIHYFTFTSLAALLIVADAGSGTFPSMVGALVRPLLAEPALCLLLRANRASCIRRKLRTAHGAIWTASATLRFFWPGRRAAACPPPLAPQYNGHPGK